MEITFLGTGAGMPAKSRNVTSIALKHLSDGAVWLFDCGEATQHQILHTSIRLRKLRKYLSPICMGTIYSVCPVYWAAARF